MKLLTRVRSFLSKFFRREEPRTPAVITVREEPEAPAPAPKEATPANLRMHEILAARRRHAAKHGNTRTRQQIRAELRRQWYHLYADREHGTRRQRRQMARASAAGEFNEMRQAA